MTFSEHKVDQLVVNEIESKEERIVIAADGSSPAKILAGNDDFEGFDNVEAGRKAKVRFNFDRK